jgi:glycosyltransferase involved in cell wall biosynthesis
VKRVAIVVPRCHESLVGGAEALAWQYATLLADRYEVELLTSCASDYVHWNNDLAAGLERRNGVAIRRFRVARPRGSYFHDLHRRLLARFAARDREPAATRIDWPEALQEEFIRAQGPICPDLVAYLRTHGDDYAAVIFVTYLYPTTLDGARALRHRRWALVPTLHDEATGYFSVLARLGAQAPSLMWNTPGEQRLGRRLWGVDAGSLVSMSVATAPVDAALESTPYLLYCGRIDSHKGCAMLINAFETYKRTNPSNLQLVLTGADKLGLAASPSIRYLGFVDEARKFALMAGALAFVHPSPNESLSIVALEAMAQGTPMIANGTCEVLADHIKASDAGWVFHDAAGLHGAIDAVRALTVAERAEQGRRSRDYVIGTYSEASVRARLIHQVETLAAS